MDEIFVGATDDVVVGDGDGVNAAPTGLQHVNTLQRPDIPNLVHRQRKTASDRTSGGKEVGGGDGGILWKGRTHAAHTHSRGKSELLDSLKLSISISMATHSGAIDDLTGESCWPIIRQH